MKQYKAVAGPKSISVDKGNTQAAFDSFAGLINQHARDGWEYHSTSPVKVTRKLSKFKSREETYNAFVFVKEVKEPALPTE